MAGAYRFVLRPCRDSARALRPALLPEGRPEARAGVFSSGANQRSPSEEPVHLPQRLAVEGYGDFDLGCGLTRSVSMYHTELVLLGGRQHPMRRHEACMRTQAEGQGA